MSVTNQTISKEDSAEAFIQSLDDEQKREDSKTLLNLMQEVTGKEPVMWGATIIGFDEYHYKYDSGREGDFFIIGFSPRKENMSIYIMPGLEKYSKFLGDLGTHKTGQSCLYVNDLSQINLDALRKVLVESVNYMRTNYPPLEEF